MGIGDDVLRGILALDPLRATSLSLQAALEQTGARALGLFSLQDGRCRLTSCTADLNQNDLDRVSQAWSVERSRLAAGEHLLVDGAAVIVPLGHPPSAILYASGSEVVATAVLAPVIRDLGRLLELLASVRVEDAPERVNYRRYIERTPIEEIEREKILLLLRRHNWNKSRVAELMQITRPTLYKKIKRYGLTERGL